MEKHISATAIDNCMWDIEYYLMRKFGTRAAQMDMYALRWYINTGCAPTDFLKLIINAKPFMVARILHKAPTDNEAIASVKRYLRFNA